MVYLMTPQTAKKTKSSKLKVFVSIIILILLMLFAWLQESMNAEQIEVKPYITDLEQLWNWSDMIYAGGAENGQWHLRWDAAVPSEGMARLSELLFVDNRGRVIPKTIRQNGNIIEGKGLIIGSQVILSKIEADADTEKIAVLLKLEHKSLSSIKQLQLIVEGISALIQAEDNNAELSMKVIGESEKKDAMNYLLRLTVGRVIEQYEDAGTLSKTMFSPQLNSYKWIDREKMANIQISVHEHSQTKQQVITLGIPLISGEFGETS